MRTTLVLNERLIDEVKNLSRARTKREAVQEAMKDYILMSLWDALIWSTAKMNQIPAVLSEDFSHNSVIEGVRLIDPFTIELHER